MNVARGRIDHQLGIMNRSPDEVVSRVEDHQSIFLHGGCATSLVLERALAERAHTFQDLRVIQMHKEGPEPLAAPELSGHVRVGSLFCGPGIREAIAEGRADYIPAFLSDIPGMFRDGSLRVDVAIVQLSPPDAHGFCSLGNSVDVAREGFRAARLRLAEINHRMPRTHGDTFVHLEELDAWTVTDRPLVAHTPVPETETAKAIGAHVAQLVQEGATLQVGIGTVGDAVLAALQGHRDLAIHTEMFSDTLVDLFESGAIATRPRQDGRSPIVTSFVIGTNRVMDFVHDNPAVTFWPSDVTNDTAIIRRQPRMTSVNGAIALDLTGQVCADSMGPRIHSGIGGQMDFVRGSALAENGRAIIALPSTARGGTVSRIVPMPSTTLGVFHLPGGQRRQTGHHSHIRTDDESGTATHQGTHDAARNGAGQGTAEHIGIRVDFIIDLANGGLESTPTLVDQDLLALLEPGHVQRLFRGQERIFAHGEHQIVQTIPTRLAKLRTNLSGVQMTDVHFGTGRGHVRTGHDTSTRKIIDLEGHARTPFLSKLEPNG